MSSRRVDPEDEPEETQTPTALPPTPDSNHEILTPRNRKQLSATELSQLRKHHITRYSLDLRDSDTEARLMNLETSAVVWGRCHDNGCNTTYSSHYAQRKRLGAHLNTLACFEQEVDVNARYTTDESRVDGAYSVLWGYSVFSSE